MTKSKDAELLDAEGTGANLLPELLAEGTGNGRPLSFLTKKMHLAQMLEVSSLELTKQRRQQTKDCCFPHAERPWRIGGKDLTRVLTLIHVVYAQTFKTSLGFQVQNREAGEAPDSQNLPVLS